MTNINQMICVENARKTYKMGRLSVEALQGVNLQISRGEMTVIGGPSGSGKSTLLNLLGAMDTPTSGRITIDGEVVSDFTKKKLTNFRSRKIGFIFQSFNLVPSLNVFENIVVPMQLKNQKYDRNAVMALIERVGLEKHIQHKPDELSGGQRQRVAIARALVHKPPLILADEPTANLDSKTAQNIALLLKELNQELNVTILFASHDQWVLQAMDRKILLVDGVVTNDKKDDKV